MPWWTTAIFLSLKNTLGICFELKAGFGTQLVEYLGPRKECPSCTA